MISLTFQQIFGENASQTATTITILKADLLTLTATADNGGEQILTALLLQAHQHFEGVLTDHQNNVVTDQNGDPITHDNKKLYEKLVLSFWKRQFVTRNLQHFILDTFVLDVFLKPPTQPLLTLNADDVDYQ